MIDFIIYFNINSTSSETTTILLLYTYTLWFKTCIIRSNYHCNVNLYFLCLRFCTKHFIFIVCRSLCYCWWPDDSNYFNYPLQHENLGNLPQTHFVWAAYFSFYRICNTVLLPVFNSKKDFYHSYRLWIDYWLIR